MKKVITSFILVFILVLFGLNNIKAEEKNVEIKSIEIQEKSDNVSSNIEEETESNYNMDLELYDIDDYVTYKIIVKNNSNKDYEIDTITDNLESEYIESSYTTNNKELKKGKDIEVYLTLKYKKLISIKEESFNHNLIITLNYTNGDTSTISDIILDNNPNGNIVPSENTGINTNKVIKIICYIIIIISIIILIVMVIIRKKKLKSLGLLLLLFMIPTVFAEDNEEKCTIYLNVTLYNNYTATFKIGREVNLTMMKLAGAPDGLQWKNYYDNGQYRVFGFNRYYYESWSNENIISIEKATEEQYDNIKNNLTDENIVSIETSDYPIYMWFEVTDEDNQLGSIYWYTNVGVIYLNEDASYMFYKLRNVKKIDLSTFDTSNVINMQEMFSITGEATTTFELDISTWDVSNVTNMNYMFATAGYNATEWTIGDLSAWDVSNVVGMYCMFADSGYSTTEWDIGDISNWDVSNVTDMSFMFQSAGYNSSTFELNLSDWDVSNVIGMFALFKGAGHSATEWTIGDLSDWDVSNVSYMYDMFNGAGYNATIFDIGDLSNWDVSNVQIMGWMFATAGYSATEWMIGDLSNWNTSRVTIMDGMFYGAGHSAIEWNIGSLNIYAIDIEKMFQDCPNANASLNVYKVPRDYYRMFYSAAINPNARIVVNYSSSVSSKIDDIINTRSSNSNVVKGSII